MFSLKKLLKKEKPAKEQKEEENEADDNNNDYNNENYYDYSASNIKNENKSELRENNNYSKITRVSEDQRDQGFPKRQINTNKETYPSSSLKNEEVKGKEPNINLERNTYINPITKTNASNISNFSNPTSNQINKNISNQNTSNNNQNSNPLNNNKTETSNRNLINLNANMNHNNNNNTRITTNPLENPSKNTTNINFKYDPMTNQVKDVDVKVNMDKETAYRLYQDNKQYLPTKDQVISGAKATGNFVKESGILNEVGNAVNSNQTGSQVKKTEKDPLSSFFGSRGKKGQF